MAVGDQDASGAIQERLLKLVEEVDGLVGVIQGRTT